MSQDLVQTTIDNIKKTLDSKQNKNALIAGLVTYMLSTDNKERNTALASIAAYLLTPNEDVNNDAQ